MKKFNKVYTKVIVWEPMTDEIYETFETLEAAKSKYNISEGYDFFEERGNELWIALVD